MQKRTEIRKGFTKKKEIKERKRERRKFGRFFEMSKMKLGFTALFTLILLSMFAALASAEEFTPTPTNPAPGH